VFWITTDNADNAVSLDNLALITDGLYAGSYFHKIPLGFCVKEMPDSHASMAAPASLY
jgi:hypothetical protein